MKKVEEFKYVKAFEDEMDDLQNEVVEQEFLEMNKGYNRAEKMDLCEDEEELRVELESLNEEKKVEKERKYVAKKSAMREMHSDKYTSKVNQMKKKK